MNINTPKMKTISLTAKEFLLFKELANQIQLFFTHHVSKGEIFIEANELVLDMLGY
jgi:hypothetical protein